ncbi:MAG TPA: histidine kinase dimerization/phospho-acceptor domain-containing protein [Anaerolineaceae bacterium]|nr:histidine kinase dimerization/phospho-acceptor domain-containing protein [Anaerolineaceae bacterium]HPN51330.1 histidine kinase dimerization/phospho-acceptor domain-containing protein [Anaerolineaceae bacterium]
MNAPAVDPQRPQANESQRAFLANLRHELRTPLNAVIGYSEMMLEDIPADTDGLDELHGDLQRVIDAGRRLITLVNKVLDPARIETGELDLTRQEFVINLRHELRNPINAIISYSEVILENAPTQLAPDVERVVAAARRFQELLNGVVSYADWYGTDVPPTRLEADSANLINDVVTTLRVMDNDREKTMQPRSGGNLLVVDDNEDNRDVLARYLQRLGHVVLRAENGLRALEMLRVEPCDLILLDIMMPEMNGYQMLEHLKADTRLRDIPVIMISALDEMDNVVRCIEMGAEDYLTKPFNATLLRARVQACLDKKLLHDQEAAMLASQRMAELGTLVAGIAHELNSPLQVITGQSKSLLSRLQSEGQVDQERLTRGLTSINRNGWRSAEIIRALLTYARASTGDTDAFDLNDIVRDTLLLTEHQLKNFSNINIITEFGNDLPPLYCNRNQITQMLINLLTNARDAIKDGGDITIRTSLDPETRRLVIQVSDTGCGIPEPVLDKIFNPFFTTKPLGQGTGLGLSTVIGIVRAHGGEIKVLSKPGEGTTFSVLLPENPPPDLETNPRGPGRFDDSVFN